MFQVEYGIDGRPSRVSGDTLDELHAALTASRPVALPMPGFMVGAMLDAARRGDEPTPQPLPQLAAPARDSGAYLAPAKPKRKRRKRTPKAKTGSDHIRTYLRTRRDHRPRVVVDALAAQGVTVSRALVTAVKRQRNGKAKAK